MRAAQINEYGGVEQVVVQETPMPVAKEGQVIVKIMSTSINPFDVMMRSGAVAARIPLTLPYTQGGDMSGVIEATGETVYGTAHVANGGSGAMAEYAAVNTANLAPKPESLSFDQAASLPLVATSAIQAIEQHINLKSGQKILIQGGAGGIGTIAIQIAKSRGAYVAATASADDTDMLKELGADQVIDYKNEDFAQLIRDYDAVFDTVGGEVTARSIAVIKKGGILVSMVRGLDESLAHTAGINAIYNSTKVTTDSLNRIAELVAARAIRPVVDRTFMLDQAKAAYTYFEKESPRGKVIVTVASQG